MEVRTQQLIGTLDIETVLRDGAVRFSPGLLAKAHHGVLYVDEVNLLPDALVDALRQRGCHQTDIGDAFYFADPEWLTR